MATVGEDILPRVVDSRMFLLMSCTWVKFAVISTLPFQVSVLVLAHTRELAYQISREYERFSKYMNSVRVAFFFGGMPIKKDEEILKNKCPHVVVGTPGRILALTKTKMLILKHIKHFILDECDKMLDELGTCSGIYKS